MSTRTDAARRRAIGLFLLLSTCLASIAVYSNGWTRWGAVLLIVGQVMALSYKLRALKRGDA